MWSRIPICCWPAVWLSVWLAGAATATVYRLPMTRAPRAPHRLRTPLLSLHVSMLRPSPRAGLTRRHVWLKPPLHLVNQNLGAS